jgi:hypothetical protein
MASTDETEDPIHDKPMPLLEHLVAAPSRDVVGRRILRVFRRLLPQAWREIRPTSNCREFQARRKIARNASFSMAYSYLS